VRAAVAGRVRRRAEPVNPISGAFRRLAIRGDDLADGLDVPDLFRQDELGEAFVNTEAHVKAHRSVGGVDHRIQHPGSFDHALQFRRLEMATRPT
jgi:hypothetical protein